MSEQMIESLLKAAEEIIFEGQLGWANVCTDAARHIESLEAQLQECRKDAARYAAKRKAMFLCRNRLHVSGSPISEEEFNREYDASCDKHIDGYVIDHRGVFVKDAAMSQEKAG